MSIDLKEFDKAPPETITRGPFTWTIIEDHGGRVVRSDLSDSVRCSYRGPFETTLAARAAYDAGPEGLKKSISAKADEAYGFYVRIHDAMMEYRAGLGIELFAKEDQ